MGGLGLGRRCGPLICAHLPKVGSKVSKGQPVCIIEAMKLMNEIEVIKMVLIEM